MQAGYKSDLAIHMYINSYDAQYVICQYVYQY